MISLLLTLVLGFTSDPFNSKDIILILGYNCNIPLIVCYNLYLSIIYKCPLEKYGTSYETNLWRCHYSCSYIITISLVSQIAVIIAYEMTTILVSIYILKVFF